MTKKKNDKKKTGMLSVDATIAENRRSRYEYAIEETFEAGIMLVGTEVKSLRLSQASINEGYVGPREGALWLFNINISEYGQVGARAQHDPKRPRKLLLKKREIDKLMGAVNKAGYTIVPLKLFFDARGLAKVLIGLGKGKKLHDKRETEKNRDWNKQKSRILREKG